MSEDRKEFSDLTQKGIYLARQGKTAEALSCFDKAMEIAPKKATGLYNKSVGLCLLGKYDEGIDLLEEAFKLDPSIKGASKEMIAFDKIRNDDRFKKLFE